MTRNEILSQLNAEQAAAAGKHDGPVLVLAGAGTGKTRVITFRIACMLADGIVPESILGLTFTNKAAREMRERLAQLVDPECAEKVTLGTFHSFCIRILKKHIAKLGFTTGFTIADDSDQQGIFKQALGECGFAYDGFYTLALQKMNFWKNHLYTPEKALRNAENEMEAKAAHVYEKYRDLMEMQNLIDFDDMLLLAWRIFTEHPEVLTEYQQRYEYLLVDEYQDTNGAQFELVKMLAGKKCNLCVVGDDDQSIYSWRGAEVENILNFPQHFPGTMIIKLEQNYRSCSAILNAANAVIGTGTHRHAKKLWSALGAGEKPKILLFDREDDEAEFVAQLIRSRRAERPELKFCDFAVLYRSNALAKKIQQSLTHAGIPSKVVEGDSKIDHQENKNALAYLKLLINPKDDQSLLRILAAPPRGIGPKAVSELKRRRAEKNIPMSLTLRNTEFQKSLTSKGQVELQKMLIAFDTAKKDFASVGNLASKIEKFLYDVGYLNGLQKIYKDAADSEKRRDRVYEDVIKDSSYFEKKHKDVTLEDYLDSCSLMENSKNDPNVDAVTLTSIHAAKGLEYPVVIQIAMEKNIFPHERAIKDRKSDDEELRLFYVAITRAKQELYLTRVRRRMIHGEMRPALPSPFLDLLTRDIAERKESADVVRVADDDTVKRAFEEAIRLLMAER